jgi:hypothetical protein
MYDYCSFTIIASVHFLTFNANFDLIIFISIIIITLICIIIIVIIFLSLLI